MTVRGFVFSAVFILFYGKFQNCQEYSAEDPGDRGKGPVEPARPVDDAAVQCRYNGGRQKDIDGMIENATKYVFHIHVYPFDDKVFGKADRAIRPDKGLL